MYNIYFHALAGIPGPLWWRASRLCFIYSFLSGNLVKDVRKLHGHYGNVVRIAPDEVSFAHEDVWQAAFSSRNPLPRNPTFFKAPPGQADNIVMTADPVASARMRQVAMPAFTKRALAKQVGCSTIFFFRYGLADQLGFTHIRNRFISSIRNYLWRG